MRILGIVFLFIILTLPAEAEVIQGGVRYSINSAREELLNTPEISVPNSLMQSNLFDIKTEIKDRSLAKFSDGSYAVIYKDNPKFAWYYSQNGILTHVQVKTSETYPYKSYKYTPDNQLVNMSLRVSKEETFIYTPSGKFIAHWLYQNCYDENNNIIMTRQIYE